MGPNVSDGAGPIVGWIVMMVNECETVGPVVVVVGAAVVVGLSVVVVSCLVVVLCLVVDVGLAVEVGWWELAERCETVVLSPRAELTVDGASTDVDDSRELVELAVVEVVVDSSSVGITTWPSALPIGELDEVMVM